MGNIEAAGFGERKICFKSVVWHRQGWVGLGGFTLLFSCFSFSIYQRHSFLTNIYIDINIFSEVFYPL